MSEDSTAATAPVAPSDFIREIVAQHVLEGRYPGIVTRFPPEPNGYLHIGHAKSICLNFGLALENGGRCNLRMDDTNPAKEDQEYVDAIVADVRWLIAGWADHVLGLKPVGATAEAVSVAGAAPMGAGAGASGERVDFYAAPAAAGTAAVEPFFASDYFEALHACAVELIRRRKAYVCDLSAEDTESYRGSPDVPGRDSPYRERSVEENLELFARMRAGEFPNGARSLRARIDMASPNLWLRDPLLYRIRHAEHHHTGARWCIYPLYDFAHCLSDYFEGISHSICTLEFTDHRPLYDWLLEALDLARPLPRQYEFAKLIPTYTLVSKRRLMKLVESGVVDGWDDPRMATLSGLRRRGIPAAALRQFVLGLGVTKYESSTDIALFEFTVRETLNLTAQRRLAVLRPLKLVLTNLAPGEVIWCTAIDNPQAEVPSTRTVPLTRELFIEDDDFAEVPPPKYFRLKPGGEVRLKYACIIKLDQIVKAADGTLSELHATADLTTRTGGPNADKKVKGTIHWVSASQAVTAEVRLYDRLFSVPEPADAEDYLKCINPHSREVVTAHLEPSLAAADPALRYQFERLGYFTVDTRDSRPGALVFNRTLALKDAAKAPGK